MLVLAVAAALAGCGESELDGGVVTPESETVARIGDGDTLDLRDGERVRLVQIDAPELGDGECYARQARRELERLAPPRSVIAVSSDPDLDDRDRFGRLLRYVFRSGLNVNVELVLRGAAAPYFRDGEEGLYASQLLAAVEDARSARRGLWGECRVEWRSDRPVATHPR